MMRLIPGSRINKVKQPLSEISFTNMLSRIDTVKDKPSMGIPRKGPHKVGSSVKAFRGQHSTSAIQNQNAEHGGNEEKLLGKHKGRNGNGTAQDQRQTWDPRTISEEIVLGFQPPMAPEVKARETIRKGGKEKVGEKKEDVEQRLSQCSETDCIIPVSRRGMYAACNTEKLA